MDLKAPFLGLWHQAVYVTRPKANDKPWALASVSLELAPQDCPSCLELARGVLGRTVIAKGSRSLRAASGLSAPPPRVTSLSKLGKVSGPYQKPTVGAGTRGRGAGPPPALLALPTPAAAAQPPVQEVLTVKGYRTTA